MAKRTIDVTGLDSYALALRRSARLTLEAVSPDDVRDRRSITVRVLTDCAAVPLGAPAGSANLMSWTYAKGRRLLVPAGASGAQGTRYVTDFRLWRSGSNVGYTLRLASSQSQSASAQGEDLDTGWERRIHALRVAIGADAVDLPGPGHLIWTAPGEPLPAENLNEPYHVGVAATEPLVGRALSTFIASAARTAAQLVFCWYTEKWRKPALPSIRVLSVTERSIRVRIGAAGGSLARFPQTLDGHYYGGPIGIDGRSFTGTNRGLPKVYTLGTSIVAGTPYRLAVKGINPAGSTTRSVTVSTPISSDVTGVWTSNVTSTAVTVTIGVRDNANRPTGAWVVYVGAHTGRIAPTALPRAVTITGLNTSTKYAIRVRYEAADRRVSAFYDGGSVTTAAPPVPRAPTVAVGTTPDDPPGNTSLWGIMSWQRGAIVTRVEWQIADDEDFTTNVRTIAKVAAKYQYTGLTVGKSYWIRGRIGNSSGLSAYSRGAYGTSIRAPSITATTGHNAGPVLVVQDRSTGLLLSRVVITAYSSPALTAATRRTGLSTRFDTNGRARWDLGLQSSWRSLASGSSWWIGARATTPELGIVVTAGPLKITK